MAWTLPKTWTAVVVTVADLNTHIRDNLNILKTSINDDGTVKTCVGKTTATVDYTNSTVHTGVGVFTVPGNTLGTGNVIRMTHDGFINATGSSRNLTVRVLWGNGGTIITAFSYVQSMTASTISAFRLECDVIAAGATNVQHIVTRYTLPVVGGTPGTTGAGGISSNTIMGAYQSASIDSTADQVLQVTYEWSAADANNHAYAHATTWEVLRTT